MKMTKKRKQAFINFMDKHSKMTSCRQAITIDGRQYFSDGYRLARCAEIIDENNACPFDIILHVNWEKIFPAEYACKTIKLPSEKELFALRHEQHSILYLPADKRVCTAGKYRYKTKFLIDLVQAIPNPTVTYVDEHGYLVAQDDEGNKAMVLPRRN